MGGGEPPLVAAQGRQRPHLVRASTASRSLHGSLLIGPNLLQLVKREETACYMYQGTQ